MQKNWVLPQKGPRSDLGKVRDTNRLFWLCIIFSLLVHLLFLSRFTYSSKSNNISPLEFDLITIKPEPKEEPPKIEETKPEQFPPPPPPEEKPKPKIKTPTAKRERPAIQRPLEEAIVEPIGEEKSLELTSDPPTSEPLFAAVQPPPPPQPVGPSEKELENFRQNYLQLIRSRIEANKQYPLIARRQHWEGKVGLRFTVNQNSKVEEIRVISSSGYQLLDKAAINAIENASPFPPPPDTSLLPLHLELTIVFELR